MCTKKLLAIDVNNEINYHSRVDITIKEIKISPIYNELME